FCGLIGLVASGLLFQKMASNAVAQEDAAQEDAAQEEPTVEQEEKNGLQDLAAYQGMQACANRVKNDLLAFLIEQKSAGKKVAAYGAAAKGNTLLNYAGVRPDLLPFVCDAAPSKQGKYLPGSRIPILDPSVLKEYAPDYFLILPWNLKEEIIQQLESIRSWKGQFVTAVPELIQL
ncbi:MAG: hypothetical protein D3912_06060, partial [Candidatus Electrothrix sp. AX1]|nr:hypothetical protein [Candidatus Electrothrix sp. AX1]